MPIAMVVDVIGLSFVLEFSSFSTAKLASDKFTPKKLKASAGCLARGCKTRVSW